MTGRHHQTSNSTTDGGCPTVVGNLLAQVRAATTPAAVTATTGAGTTLTWMAEGVLRIDPPSHSALARDLVISAGIHGNETAPIELLDRLLARIAADRCVPRSRMLAILGNPAAIRTGQRYLDYDLNRLFNGGHRRHPGDAAERALMLEKQVQQFYAQAPVANRRERLHYDLHTAIRGSRIEKFALYPESPLPLARLSCARLHSADITTVVLQKAPASTFTAFSANACAADSMTLELGKALPFGANGALDLQALEAMLTTLITGGDVDPDKARPDAVSIYRAAREIIKQSDAFRLHLADDVENFTRLPIGMVLAEDGDDQVIVHEAEARILFPNARVKNGLRAGIIVVPALY